MRRALALRAALCAACGGAEFTSGDEAYFEYLTPSDAEREAADQALACGCEFLGSYEGKITGGALCKQRAA
jgi:hypothetical protein